MKQTHVNPAKEEKQFCGRGSGKPDMPIGMPVQEATGEYQESSYETIESADEIRTAVQSYVDGFGGLADSQKEWMLQNIREKRVKKLRMPVKKAFSAAAIFMCIVFVGGVGADAASGGKVVESIKKLWDIEPESVEIIENMTPEAEVYAPLLLDCDKERIIFATSRGIVVYGRDVQGILAVIDLQKIGCNYFTTDSLETKVIVDSDRLTVFNVKRESGAPQGDCYAYNLPEKREAKGEIRKLEPAAVEKAKKGLFQQWEEKMGKHCRDTFELICETVQKWQEKTDESVKYSEQSVSWQESGKKMYACLLLCESAKGQEYKLYTWRQDTGEASEEVLALQLSGEASKQNSQANELPQFVYSGKDEIMRVICEYLAKNEAKYMDSDSGKVVVIPAPIIFDQVKEGKEVKIFGNFWALSYYKNGNTLENYGGGEMPACIHLKKENGAYKIVKVEKTGDGEYYQKGIEQFCSGYPEIYEKFFDDRNFGLRDKILKKMMERYVSDNRLDIRYYHDYGWDPVELDVD